MLLIGKVTDQASPAVRISAIVLMVGVPGCAAALCPILAVKAEWSMAERPKAGGSSAVESAVLLPACSAGSELQALLLHVLDPVHAPHPLPNQHRCVQLLHNVHAAACCITAILFSIRMCMLTCHLDQASTQCIVCKASQIRYQHVPCPCGCALAPQMEVQLPQMQVECVLAGNACSSADELDNVASSTSHTCSVAVAASMMRSTGLLAALIASYTACCAGLHCFQHCTAACSSTMPDMSLDGCCLCSIAECDSILSQKRPTDRLFLQFVCLLGWVAELPSDNN